MWKEKIKIISLSLKIYIGLITTLSILSAINVFLPQGSFLPVPSEKTMPAPKPILAIINSSVMFFLYGGVGLIGLKLSKKIGFADIWDSKITNKQRFLIPAFTGIIIGVFLILTDLIISQVHTLGRLPHPPFPTSLVASITAGIGEELIFRLFFVSFWVWLISYVLLKKRWEQQIFWIVAVISGFIFAIGHLPSVMLMFNLKTISSIPLALLFEIIILNGVLSLFAAYYLKKYGFLAAAGVHFWTDVVWHVIWGLF